MINFAPYYCLNMKNIFVSVVILLLVSCNSKETKENFLLVEKPENFQTPIGMVWVSGASFTQGAKEGDYLALPHEKPSHSVEVDGFFIDITEVTNAQFKKFVDATGYVTTAERPVIWEEMKKTLPEGTPKPHDSLLKPGSLVFYKDIQSITDLNNYQQWWRWTSGANWRHPYGKNSSIEGKDNYPVVQVSYEDALAYCKWADRDLPTESQWELAAMGSLKNSVFTWGNDKNKLDTKANTWQGSFPVSNSKKDGYQLLSPVKTFEPNSIGIYEMSGNVWEYTKDWYNSDYYQELQNLGGVVRNPQGAKSASNPNNPYQAERIIKGGSFLCNENYCSSFRISARMGMTEDSSSDHVGFRTVKNVKILKSN